MKFWASCEGHLPAYEGVKRCRHAVEPYLNAAFAASSLASLDLELRYVPIVMPVDMHDKYTERSRARIKQRIYDCAPQLDYETFVSGSFAEQLADYLRGVALSAPHLNKFGATYEQVRTFEAIMASAAGDILNSGG
jgi:hypothetical protein